MSIADYQLMLGRFEEAERMLRGARDACEQHGDWNTCEEVLDVLMRADVLQERWGPARARLALRLPWARSTQDHWRITAYCIIDALIEAETSGSEADARRATETMLEAFAHVSHDEAFSHMALGKLAARLFARGIEDLGKRVRDLVDERSRAIEKGLAPVDERADEP